MLLVPDICLLIYEAIELNMIVKDFDCAIGPGKVESAPIPSRHAIGKWTTTLAGCQQIADIRDDVWVKGLRACCDNPIDFNSNRIPVLKPHILNDTVEIGRKEGGQMKTQAKTPKLPTEALAPPVPDLKAYLLGGPKFDDFEVERDGDTGRAEEISNLEPST